MIPFSTYALIYGIPLSTALFSLSLWIIGGKIFGANKKYTDGGSK